MLYGMHLHLFTTLENIHMEKVWKQVRIKTGDRLNLSINLKNKGCKR